MLFLFLLAQLKNFKQISLIALLANIGVVLALIAIQVDSAYLVAYREVSPPEFKYYVDWYKVPQFVARVSLSFECISVIPGLYSSTKERSKF
jgi:hypothetical protein